MTYSTLSLLRCHNTSPGWPSGGPYGPSQVFVSDKSGVLNATITCFGSQILGFRQAARGKYNCNRCYVNKVESIWEGSIWLPQDRVSVARIRINTPKLGTVVEWSALSESVMRSCPKYFGVLRTEGRTELRDRQMDLCTISSNADFVPGCWGEGAEPKGNAPDLHVDPRSDPHLWPLPVAERARSQTQAAKTSFLCWIPALALWDRLRSAVIWDLIRFVATGPYEADPDWVVWTSDVLEGLLVRFYWRISQKGAPQKVQDRWKNYFSKMT